MAHLRWEPCVGERARITYYSQSLTWSIGWFLSRQSKYDGWRADDGGGLDDGVLWFPYGSFFIHHITPKKDVTRGKRMPQSNIPPFA